MSEWVLEDALGSCGLFVLRCPCASAGRMTTDDAKRATTARDSGKGLKRSTLCFSLRALDGRSRRSHSWGSSLPSRLRGEREIGRAAGEAKVPVSSSSGADLKRARRAEQERTTGAAMPCLCLMTSTCLMIDWGVCGRSGRQDGRGQDKHPLSTAPQSSAFDGARVCRQEQSPVALTTARFKASPKLASPL